MNKNDSERLAALLLSLGMEEAKTEKEADLVIINSCSVRESAESRVGGLVNSLTRLRLQRPRLIIGVTGCLPGRDKQGLLRRKMPQANLFFSSSEMGRLPGMLAEFFPGLKTNTFSFSDYLKIQPRYDSEYRAFVTIQTGCSQFCTYCVVPQARGLTKQRPLIDILTEIRDLDNRGYKEIVLLGQIVNQYQAPDPENFSVYNPFQQDDFARLLWEVNQLKSIERVHWTAPHPRYLTDETIVALTLPKQVNYLHLPVQAGNNEVLRRMNRGYTREEYLQLVLKIKQTRPGLALGTDIIVGFSGETEQQFEDTVSLYQQCDFDIAYLAKYSPRPGTAAARAWADDVSWDEKKRRWRLLQDLMEKTTYQKNQQYVGQIKTVLVDKYQNGQNLGQSEEQKLVSFVSDQSLVGKMVRVRIKEAAEWILRGTVV